MGGLALDPDYRLFFTNEVFESHTRKDFSHIQKALPHEKKENEELFREHTSAFSLPRHLLASFLSIIIEFSLC